MRRSARSNCSLVYLWPPADFLACLLTAFDLHALTVLDDVVDAQLEIFQTEGLGEEFVSASLECLLLVFLICLGRKQNDRQVVVVGVALDRTREFESIHLRHHNIGDNQIECLGLDDLQCLSTILCYVDSIVGLQQLLHEHQQFEVVLDNQQFVVVLIIGVVVCIGLLWRKNVLMGTMSQKIKDMQSKRIAYQKEKTKEYMARVASYLSVEDQKILYI